LPFQPKVVGILVVAKEHGVKIIEINIEKTHFPDDITDIFLKGKASEIMKGIRELLYL
jgi:NAD-dependent SIR2 family protein deacetylase